MKNSPETLKKRNALKRKWKKEIDPNSFPHQIKRKCKDCGKIKMCDWQSSFTQTGQPEYRARCKKCHNIYERKLRKRPEAKKARNLSRQQKGYNRKKKLINEFDGKCEVCGYSKCLSALTFHHKSSKNKNFQISGTHLIDKPYKEIKKEAKKCQLLCFNCHMEVHHLERENKWNQ
jgi:hypothetical protein